MESTGVSTNCPKCNAPIGAGVEECPQCGILFSKWQQRETNVAAGNMERYTIANATSSEFNWAILVIICIVIGAVFFFLEKSQ